MLFTWFSSCPSYGSIKTLTVVPPLPVPSSTCTLTKSTWLSSSSSISRLEAERRGLVLAVRSLAAAESISGSKLVPERLASIVIGFRLTKFTTGSNTASISTKPKTSLENLAMFPWGSSISAKPKRTERPRSVRNHSRQFTASPHYNRQISYAYQNTDTEQKH